MFAFKISDIKIQIIIKFDAAKSTNMYEKAKYFPTQYKYTLFNNNKNLKF